MCSAWVVLNDGCTFAQRSAFRLLGSRLVAQIAAPTLFFLMVLLVIFISAGFAALELLAYLQEPTLEIVRALG